MTNDAPTHPPALLALLRVLRTADGLVARLESACLVGGILGMTLLGIANVAARNLLGISLVFAEEVNQMLIVLVTFAGIGYAAREGRHIRMTAFYDQLPPTARRWLMAAIAALTAALLFALAGYAVSYVQHTRDAGSVTPALRVPLYAVYLVVPVGLALGGLQYALTAVRNVVADEVHLSFTRKDDIGADVEGVL